MKSIIAIATFVVFLPAAALAEQSGIANQNAPSNFDRTHRVIEQRMQTGNDRAPPLGQGPGERAILGGSQQGGNAPNGVNQRNMNTRNQ